MTLILVDGSPLMFFQTLDEALSYIRHLSNALRGRLTLTRYAGHPLSR